MSAPLLHQFRLCAKPQLQGVKFRRRKIISFFLFQLVRRNVPVKPQAIAFQSVAVTALDGFQIGSALKPRREAFAGEPHQSKQGQSISRFEINNVAEFVRQDRAQSVVRHAVREKVSIDAQQTAQPLFEQKTGEGEAGLKVIRRRIEQLDFNFGVVQIGKFGIRSGFDLFDDSPHTTRNVIAGLRTRHRFRGQRQRDDQHNHGRFSHRFVSIRRLSLLLLPCEAIVRL